MSPLVRCMAGRAIVNSNAPLTLVACLDVTLTASEIVFSSGPYIPNPRSTGTGNSVMFTSPGICALVIPVALRLSGTWISVTLTTPLTASTGSSSQAES